MGLESGTFVDDLVTSNPVGGSDDLNKGDDHLRLIKSVLKTTFPNATKAFRFETILTKTSAYPVVAADARALILADASGGVFTITLPLGSAVFAGYTILIVKSDSSSNVVTVDGNGSETISGAATRSLSAQYQTEKYTWDGSEWKLVSITRIGTTELLNDSVTFAKMQNITTARLLGRTTASSGDTEEVAVDSTMALSALVLGVANLGVDTAQLAASAVETAKINNLAVTAAKIAANAVDGTKIALGSDAQGDVMYYDGTDWVRLAVGTADYFLQTKGAGANPVWTNVGGLIATTLFTGANTWTPNASAKTALIFCTGGGGGGGPTDNTTDGGGGAGATSIHFIADTTSIGGQTITVGSGGNAQSNGGASSVASLAVAGGGSGTSVQTGGAGGTATAGTMQIRGGGGGSGDVDASSGSGVGGASFWGGGGRGKQGSAGDDGTAYGSGGSGGSGGTTDGGSGKAGAILILEW